MWYHRSGLIGGMLVAGALVAAGPAFADDGRVPPQIKTVSVGALEAGPTVSVGVFESAPTVVVDREGGTALTLSVGIFEGDRSVSLGALEDGPTATVDRP